MSHTANRMAVATEPDAHLLTHLSPEHFQADSEFFYIDEDGASKTSSDCETAANSGNTANIIKIENDSSNCVKDVQETKSATKCKEDAENVELARDANDALIEMELNGVEKAREDPYEELENYLEKIKNEISKVFEKLEKSGEAINVLPLASDATKNNGLVEDSKEISNVQEINGLDDSSVKLRQKRQLIGDEEKGTRLQQITLSLDRRKPRLRKQDSNDWNCLEKFDNLCEKEIHNLILKNRQPPLSDSNNNILKPEKHITIPLHSFNNQTSNYLNNVQQHIIKKPPIYGSNSKLREFGANEFICVTGKDDACHDIKEARQPEWTSEDSLLKGSNTLDDDNKSSSSCEESSIILSSSKSGNSSNSISTVDGRYDKLKRPQIITSLTNYKFSAVPKTEDDIDVLSLYDGVDSENDEFCTTSSSYDNNSISKSSCENIPTNNSTHSLPLRISRKPFSQSICLGKWHLQNLQKSFQSAGKPSPGSSTSLLNAVAQNSELCNKSSSVPILIQKCSSAEDCGAPILRYSQRSQSDRYLAEIEATEAYKWLKAAGFPQYCQMFDDLQFPIDLSCVAKDHPFLEKDPLQSLYRRLVALNRCATMRLDGQHKRSNTRDDSDEDGCALSENWTFQPEIRRWSRVVEIGQMQINQLKEVSGAAQASPIDSKHEKNKVQEIPAYSSPSSQKSSTLQAPEPDLVQVRFRRSGSERLKDGAKAFLRRVESMKSRHRKRKNRDGVVISGPQMLDLTQVNQNFKDMKFLDITQSKSNPTSPRRNPVGSANAFSGQYPHFQENLNVHSISPLHYCTLKDNNRSGDDSSSYCSEVSQDSSNGNFNTIIKKPVVQKPVKKLDEDLHTLSDSECHRGFKNRSRFSSAKVRHLQVPNVSRGGSLNLGKESSGFRDNLKKRSFRSRSAIRNEDNKSTESDREDDVLIRHNSTRRSVVRYHSFQNPERASLSLRTSSPKNKLKEGISLTCMSCGQLQVIRKLALVTLTGYMERYCPTHRSGWNWDLPKFIKKIKSPDYKEKKIFGVPFVISLQRTGSTLPKSIQNALHWIKLNAMDQIGIFRKSGVKSRIAKLKALIEANSNCSNPGMFDDQQAYDVADVVKLYFRELPESLLTTKLSETFMAIFQHLPQDVRHDAIQSTIILLPDENREVLLFLLKFLYYVTTKSLHNQMNATNLAVCFAPSIFHTGISSPKASSPRRKKATGVPDAKDLSDNKASHECLAFMIENYQTIFHISSDKNLKCNFSFMDESRPVTLNSLGEGLQVQNWAGYLYECIKATVKEGRERSRGWISSTSYDEHVEISYKKVKDGHPLRLWKIVTDVEAPPIEVLRHIANERNLWDQQLLRMRVVEQLDDKSEIFQFSSINGLLDFCVDYCVLRTRCTDLPHGACVFVETSVEHPGATLLRTESVRGVVLASRYLIEPVGSGKSRIMHLARIDTKGRSREWYNRNYGHISSRYLSKIRSFFKHVNDKLPESKV